VTLRRSDDTAEVTTERDKAIFSVKSPFGISQAVIERLGPKWPKAVVLRLHLKALEHFSAANDKVTLHAVAGVREGKPEVREWQDNQEDQPLRPTDPHWIDIRVVGGDGKPAQRLPLAGGYFELTLPPALFAPNPKLLTVRWIDFYR
jgi:hypothetical protein